MDDCVDRTPGLAERETRLQRVVNARPIPVLEHQGRHPNLEPIAVLAWVCWERDGWEQVATEAVDWVGRYVRIVLFDARCEVNAVWLNADDLVRR